ncbi:hypothetical protein YC2023_116932 [Brassica napus]
MFIFLLLTRESWILDLISLFSDRNKVNHFTGISNPRLTVSNRDLFDCVTLHVYSST